MFMCYYLYFLNLGVNGFISLVFVSFAGAICEEQCCDLNTCNESYDLMPESKQMVMGRKAFFMIHRVIQGRHGNTLIDFAYEARKRPHPSEML